MRRPFQPSKNSSNLPPPGAPPGTFSASANSRPRTSRTPLAHLEKGQALGTGDDPEMARVAKYHLALLLNRSGDFERASSMLVSAFGQSQLPPQAKVALGLALLRAPLLPDELDPSQDALVHAAGEAASAMAQQSDSLKARDPLRANKGLSRRSLSALRVRQGPDRGRKVPSSPVPAAPRGGHLSTERSA